MARRGDLNGWWRFGVVVVAFLARLAFRIHVAGAERVHESGPAILACNHVSALDGLMLALTTARHARRMTRFLVAAEFFDTATVGWALRLYRHGHNPTHTIRPDVAVLLDDITVRGIPWSAGPFLPVLPDARCRQ